MISDRTSLLEPDLKYSAGLREEKCEGKGENGRGRVIAWRHSEVGRREELPGPQKLRIPNL